MLSNFVVTHSEFLSELELHLNDGLTVEFSEENPSFVVRITNFDPHPFALHTWQSRKLYLHMISAIVLAHAEPRLSRQRVSTSDLSPNSCNAIRVSSILCEEIPPSGLTSILKVNFSPCEPANFESTLV
jgi:hypothetical protein